MNVLNADLNIVKDACRKIFEETLLLVLNFSRFDDLIEESHGEILNHLFPHLKVGVDRF